MDKNKTKKIRQTYKGLPETERKMAILLHMHNPWATSFDCIEMAQKLVKEGKTLQDAKFVVL